MRNSEVNLISEGDIYRLIARSHLPAAEKFESFIFDEVIPSIRKYGGYIHATDDEEGDEIMQRALNLANQRVAENKKRLAERERQLHQAEQETESLKVALNRSLEYYTVMKYARVYGYNWNMRTRQKVGKDLTKYCRSRGIQIRKCLSGDDRFDETNSYPISAWENFMNQYR
jgi:hypothetical protein